MFKKIIALCALLIGLQSASYAAYSEVQMCADVPSSVDGPISKLLSNATGTNFLLTKIAEAAAQKELKKEFNSHFNVELYPFGGKNLLDGKFKGVKIESKKIISDELNTTNFSAASLCDYNHITIKDNELDFVENFLMEYSAQLTSDDLKRTLLSPSYLRLMDRLNLKIAGFSVFKISDPSIEIKGDRLQMSVKASSPTPFNVVQTVNVDTGIKIENEKIVFSDIKVGSLGNLDLNYVLPIINRMNPFVQKVPLDSKNTLTIRIKDVSMANNTIYTKGLVVIPKTR